MGKIDYLKEKLKNKIYEISEDELISQGYELIKLDKFLFGRTCATKNGKTYYYTRDILDFERNK